MIFAADSCRFYVDSPRKGRIPARRGIFPWTIEGICKDGNAPPVNVPTARGGLVLDVGIGDAVGFGVVLGVGVGEDTEGEVIAIIKGIVTDAGDTAEVAHAR